MWWLIMRGPCPQSHVTLQYRGHVTNRKRYISSFTRPMDRKLNRAVTYNEGTSLTKSRDISMTWSRDKSKTLYLHIHKIHSPQDLVGCWLGMKWPDPKSPVRIQSCGHITIQKRLISSAMGPMATKLSKMLDIL